MERDENAWLRERFKRTPPPPEKISQPELQKRTDEAIEVLKDRLRDLPRFKHLTDGDFLDKITSCETLPASDGSFYRITHEERQGNEKILGIAKLRRQEANDKDPEVELLLKEVYLRSVLWNSKGVIVVEDRNSENRFKFKNEPEAFEHRDEVLEEFFLQENLKDSKILAKKSSSVSPSRQGARVLFNRNTGSGGELFFCNARIPLNASQHILPHASS